MGSMNNARDPLKKQKNAFFFLHETHNAHSQKKKKNGQNADTAFINCIQMGNYCILAVVA